MGREISRRDFVKGFGAGAALALGGLGLPRPGAAKLVGPHPAWKYVQTGASLLNVLDPHVLTDIPSYSYKL